MSEDLLKAAEGLLASALLAEVPETQALRDAVAAIREKERRLAEEEKARAEAIRKSSLEYIGELLSELNLHEREATELIERMRTWKKTHRGNYHTLRGFRGFAYLWDGIYEAAVNGSGMYFDEDLD